MNGRENMNGRSGSEKSHPDAEADFRGEDPELWQLLGALEDIHPDGAFVDGCASQVDTIEPDRSWAGTWAWRWAAGAAAVAAAVILVVNFPEDSDSRKTLPGGPAVSADALDDDDFFALELDHLQDVNEDWFGS